MKTRLFNIENFHLGTTANFYKVEEPKEEPDQIFYSGRKKFLPNSRNWDDIFDFQIKDNDGNIDGYLLIVNDEEYNPVIYEEYKIIETKEDGILLKNLEKISSKNWYTKKGVYRMSNHWGNIRENKWSLNGHTINGSENDEMLVGFCPWENFKEIF